MGKTSFIHFYGTFMRISFVLLIGRCRREQELFLKLNNKRLNDLLNLYTQFLFSCSTRCVWVEKFCCICLFDKIVWRDRERESEKLYKSKETSERRCEREGTNERSFQHEWRLGTGDTVPTRHATLCRWRLFQSARGEFINK